jgi:hypothetical protein
MSGPRPLKQWVQRKSGSRQLVCPDGGQRGGNVNSPAVDRVVQEYAGKAELGVMSFTVWHRNYDNAFYDLLMNSGQWTDPSRL